MKRKDKNRIRSEEEVDSLVISQANDDSAWEAPICVKKSKPVSVLLPSELAERAMFFAKLHREVSLEDWFRRVIDERLNMEEAAFCALKRDLSTKGVSI